MGVGHRAADDVRTERIVVVSLRRRSFGRFIADVGTGPTGGPMLPSNADVTGWMVERRMPWSPPSEPTTDTLR
jgi:hypothetical protein